jgi:hypothetical protein
MEATLGLLWATVTLLLLGLHRWRFGRLPRSRDLERADLQTLLAIGVVTAATLTVGLMLETSWLGGILAVAVWGLTVWIGWLTLRAS